ncbi:Serine proteases trypsin domain [Trinorchestia longiramus]|nr:Serine proteases trypsin domain [Trinorchestia longiramus]
MRTIMANTAVFVVLCVVSRVVGDPQTETEEILEQVQASRNSFTSVEDVAVCSDGMMCVMQAMCSMDGPGCGDGKVCCPMGQMSDAAMMDAQMTPVDGVEGRSVGNLGSGSFDPLQRPFSNRLANRRPEPQDEQQGSRRPDQQLGDGSFNPNQPEFDNRESAQLQGSPRSSDESFRGGYSGRGYSGHDASYGGVPGGFGGLPGRYPPGLKPGSQYGSFLHVYKSQLGNFAPDFYGPGFDLRTLPLRAREVLHKYRFKEAAVLGWTPRGYGLKCSATLVNPYLLVTSAHCVEDMIEPELKIVLGVTDLLSQVPFLPALERPVARVFVHEKFNSNTLAHDIAILQLGVNVDFHFTPHIASACLPKQNQTFVASSCYIVSWTDPNPYDGPVPRTNEIKVSDMRFIPTKQECQQQVSQYARHLNPSQLTQEMHCITGNSDHSCLGSSGGSLFCDVEVIPGTADVSSSKTPEKHTFLAGIVSWSNGQCGKDSLAVITELSPYGSWIKDLLSGAGGLDNYNPDYYGGYGSHATSPVYSHNAVYGGASGYGGYGNSGGYGGASGYGGYGNSGGYGGASGYGGYGNSGYGGASGYGGYGNSGYGGASGYGGYGNPGGYGGASGYGGYGNSVYGGTSGYGGASGYGGYGNVNA